jgi:AraC-like DNA-binding protein
MTHSFSQINDFFNRLNGFRETVNVADFFFSPHLVHMTRILANDTCEVHSQRVFEVNLLLKGEVVYVIGNKKIAVRKNDVMIILPNTRHYWTVLEHDSEIFSFMINISKHGEGARRDLALLNQAIKDHNYQIKQFTRFKEIVNQIIDEINERQVACSDKVLYLMRILFIELIRALLPETPDNIFSQNFPPARGENRKDIVEMIIFYIQDNLSRSISLREIASHVGLSAGHLNSLFKQETGITINQAVINKRLEWACRYLKQTDKQIKDIATLVGYNDISYFYLQFKNKFGVTPSIYRHSHV